MERFTASFSVTASMMNGTRSSTNYPITPHPNTAHSPW